MKERVSIKEVYERLIGIHPNCNGYKQYAKQIALEVKVSSVCIHKKITKLKDDGYIVPEGKRTTFIYYSPTKKMPPNEWLTKNNNHAGGGTYQCSKSQWSCPIIKLPPPSQLKGWEMREMQNGVMQFLLMYPFVKPVDGFLQFRILGKRNYTISVDFSRIKLTEEDVINSKTSPPTWVGDFVKMALQWVKKKYNIAMDVNDVHLSFPAHSETELRDADAKQFVANAQVIVIYPDGQKIMLDRSKNNDRFESTFPSWLKEYIDLPSYRERFNKLENEILPRILNIEDKINEIYKSIEEQKQIAIKRMIENLERGIYC